MSASISYPPTRPRGPPSPGFEERLAQGCRPFVHHPFLSWLDSLYRSVCSTKECLVYVKEHAQHGDPASVITAMEEFSKTTHMVNVGPLKGAIVDAEIRKKKPLIMAELGGFAGYSAVRFGALQREVAGNKASHYYSFEFSPEYAEIIREVYEAQVNRVGRS